MRITTTLTAALFTSVLGTLGLADSAQAQHHHGGHPVGLVQSLEYNVESAHTLAHDLGALDHRYRRLESEGEELDQVWHELAQDLSHGGHRVDRRHIVRHLRDLDHLSHDMLDRVEHALHDLRPVHQVYLPHPGYSAGRQIQFRFGGIAVRGPSPVVRHYPIQIDPRRATLEQLQRRLVQIHHTSTALAQQFSY